MKYYKLVKPGGGYEESNGYQFEMGKIYPEDFSEAICLVGHYASMSTYYWEEVPESEYLLQEVKLRYPVGTCFIPAHKEDEPNTCIVTNDRFRFSGNAIYSLTDEDRIWSNDLRYGNTNFNRIVWFEGKWAETSFPERWCIKVTKENVDIIGAFYAKQAWTGYRELIHREIGKYYHSHNLASDDSILIKHYSSNFDSRSIQPGYVEITTEQFKKNIVKENLNKENNMELKITKERVLEAAKGCSTTKKALQTLFPEAFEDEKYLVINRKTLENSKIINERVVGELRGKSFWLSNEYHWEIIKDNLGEFCLLPTKKS